MTDFERERTLRQGIESVLEEMELRPLLSTVVENACRLLGADAGGVGLVLSDPRRMAMHAIYNLPESELGTEWQPGVGIAGLILTTERPMIINRYGDIDPQDRPELAEDAVLGVPILRRKKLVGFFGIGAKPPRQFTQSDARTLSQYAKACGIAIENARLFEKTQESLNQARMLYSTASALSQASRLDDVVRTYLDHVTASLNIRCSVVLYERDERDEIEWNVSRGVSLPDGTSLLTFQRSKHEPDNLDQVLEAGESLLFEDVRSDERVPALLREAQVAEGNLALALIPLMSRGRRIGLVALSRSQPMAWSEDVLRPISLTSAQFATSIDIRQEQEQLAEERANLALVEDRKRLARDLHDSVTQSMFAVQLLAQSLVGETTEVGEEKAKQLAELTRSSLKEMRQLLGELRPIADSSVHLRHTKEGLRARLERHARELGITASLEITDHGFHGTSPEIEHAVFRIAQEALTNAHKHSAADKIKVEVTDTGSDVVLAVSDNGRGFAVPEKAQAESYGLLGMGERAGSVGGTLRVESTPGSGARVWVSIPLSQ